MEQANRPTYNRGGRPQKAVKRDQQVIVSCTLLERKAIEYKAGIVGFTNSAYLREMELSGKIDRRNKVLPREVLQLTATLKHSAANLNQIARKRNSMDELNAIESAELNQLFWQVKELAGEIKNYLR